MQRSQIIWIFWLIAVIAWNYGFPTADPIWDVIIAVGLSFGVMGLKKFFYKK